MNTKLLQSAYTGDLAGVRSAIAGGANFGATVNKGLAFSEESALCLSIDSARGHKPVKDSTLAIIGIFVEHRQDVRHCGSLTNISDPVVLEYLLNHGADPNSSSDPSVGPLLSAISLWSLDPASWTQEIRLLLDFGANPNVHDMNGNSALHNLIFATMIVGRPGAKPTQAQFDEVVSLLVRKGANVNATTDHLEDKQCGPISYDNGHPMCWNYHADDETCRLPMSPCEPGRLHHYDNGVTPLMNAARGNDGLPLVKSLLAAGADPSIRDHQGCSALDSLSSEGSREFIKAYAAEHKMTPALASQECKILPPTIKFALSPPPAEAPLALSMLTMSICSATKGTLGSGWYSIPQAPSEEIDSSICTFKMSRRQFRRQQWTRYLRRRSFLCVSGVECARTVRSRAVG
ncbi:ankyrin repeat domain-containing protein [Tunturiibacter gelidiferens]|uniref:ankyrin repeat domain-containing protein n=1 Tax=Tunturiibacter gelidiferens TaxID=3069689 RepID=UPI003D9BA1BE